MRSYLKRRGYPIGAYDILIAATAQRYDLICVTDNLKEFSQVEGLKLENWKI
jgi:tRNA(fMet)-specific endonuclease VapC